MKTKKTPAGLGFKLDRMLPEIYDLSWNLTSDALRERGFSDGPTATTRLSSGQLVSNCLFDSLAALKVLNRHLPGRFGLAVYSSLYLDFDPSLEDGCLYSGRVASAEHAAFMLASEQGLPFHCNLMDLQNKGYALDVTSPTWNELVRATGGQWKQETPIPLPYYYGPVSSEIIKFMDMSDDQQLNSMIYKRIQSEWNRTFVFMSSD